MTGASIALHTGTHAGIWGAAEVAFAVAVLAVSTALVVALLRKGREETPESRLVAAATALEGRTEHSTSPSSSLSPSPSEGGRSPGDGPED
jgi:hypothetical protein